MNDDERRALYDIMQNKGSLFKIDNEKKLCYDCKKEYIKGADRTDQMNVCDSCLFFNHFDSEFAE